MLHNAKFVWLRLSENFCFVDKLVLSRGDKTLSCREKLAASNQSACDWILIRERKKKKFLCERASSAADSAIGSRARVMMESEEQFDGMKSQLHFQYSSIKPISRQKIKENNYKKKEKKSDFFEKKFMLKEMWNTDTFRDARLEKMDGEEETLFN